MRKSYFSDEILLEELDIEDAVSISDGDRVAFARSRIDNMIPNSMDSFHVLNLKTSEGHSVVLCITLYYHGQGGVHFKILSFCRSTEDFLESCQEELIMDANDLKFSKIIELWKK